MGRPVEVEDNVVIAAGLRLERRGVDVKATRIWKELGEHGRPERMFDVWNQFTSGRAATDAATASDRALMSARAIQLTAGLKASLTGELDRVAAAIYGEVESTFSARFQGELLAMQSAAAASTSETREALEAIGMLSEARQELEASARLGEQQLAATRRECELKEQMLSTAASDQRVLVEDVARLRAVVEVERTKNADLRTQMAQVETRVERLSDDLSIARDELEVNRQKIRRLEAEVVARDLMGKSRRDELERAQTDVSVLLREKEQDLAAVHSMELRAVGSEAALATFKSSLGKSSSDIVAAPAARCSALAPPPRRRLVRSSSEKRMTDASDEASLPTPIRSPDASDDMAIDMAMGGTVS